MATPSELIATMSETLGLAHAVCESTWKHLRSTNLVINSGRGNRGTQVSSRDCASFLLALCAADHVKDSVESLKRYGALPNRSQWSATLGIAALRGLKTKHSLLDGLTAVIDAYRTNEIDEVTTTIMVFPGGDTKQGPQKPSVQFSLTSPRAHAEIEVGSIETVEYERLRSTKEMFGSLLPEQPRSKRRMSAHGNLHIEKRVATPAFQALGKLLRDE